MLAEPVEYGYCHDTEGTSEHHIMRPVITVEHNPGSLADQTEEDKHTEITPTAPGIGRPLSNKESEHRKGDPA